MQYSDESPQPILVAAGELFTISLAGNPTTGYTWQAQFSGCHLELLAQEFEAASSAIGAGGRELFRFQARAPGVTEVVFEFRRPWSAEARASAKVRVEID